jgi:hypothetical protein
VYRKEDFDVSTEMIKAVDFKGAFVKKGDIRPFVASFVDEDQAYKERKVMRKKKTQ